MTRVNVQGVRLASVGVLVVLAWLVGGGLATPSGEAAQAEQTKWSPQCPREGATKLFENDYSIVWAQIGRPKEPFVHRHIRDILTFGVPPGAPDGNARHVVRRKTCFSCPHDAHDTY